jgi:hypothetical protein
VSAASVIDTTPPEEIKLARAKRTDRAEARRQYRAYLASQQEGEAAAAAEGAAEESQSRPPEARRASQQGSSGAPRPGERMGMLQAARAAARNPTYIKDVRDIVWIVTKTRAVWPTALLCLAAAALAYWRIQTGGDYKNDGILQIVFQFVLTPQIPLLPPMLAGFLAVRATWLAGAIAALISQLLLFFIFATTTLAIPTAAADATASPTISASAPAVATASAALTTPAPSPSPAADSSSSTVSGADLGIGTLAWLFQSMFMGALIAAGAGWYKRFLDNIGPRGGAPRKPQPQKRPVKRQPVRR